MYLDIQTRGSRYNCPHYSNVVKPIRDRPVNSDRLQKYEQFLEHLVSNWIKSHLGEDFSHKSPDSCPISSFFPLCIQKRPCSSLSPLTFPSLAFVFHLFVCLRLAVCHVLERHDYKSKSVRQER